MYSGLLKLCGVGFAAEAQTEQATLGTSPASLVGSESHVKVHARKVTGFHFGCLKFRMDLCSLICIAVTVGLTKAARTATNTHFNQI